VDSVEAVARAILARNQLPFASMARPRSALSKFILSLPHDLSVKEVIAKAKAKGLKTSENNVYRIRRTLGRARTKAATTKERATTPRNGASVQRPITTTSSADDLLRAVAAEIGLGRAVEILHAERTRVRAAIGG
jgi:protein involved in polysaccharide export with SLBB domain